MRRVYDSRSPRLNWILVRQQAQPGSWDVKGIDALWHDVVFATRLFARIADLRSGSR